MQNTQTPEQLAQSAFALLENGHLPPTKVGRFTALNDAFIDLTGDPLPAMVGFEKIVRTDGQSDSIGDPNDLHRRFSSAPNYSF